MMPDVSPFAKNGYQVLPKVLDPEVVSRVRSFLERQVDRQMDAACREIGCATPAELVTQIGRVTATGEQAIGSLSKDTRDTLSGHFSLEARLSSELWAIPRLPALRAVLCAILGSERLFMHMPPTARFVLPRNVYAGVPAHQDISYNRHMSDFLTVWVPLVGIDEECGGVKVYRGSGSVPELLGQDEKDKFWLKGVSAEGYAAEHCMIDIGDILVLNRWIIHESMPNRSGRTRFSIDFRFFGERDTSDKHYLDMQTWQVIPPRRAEQ